jgi:carbamoyltransferase
MLILGLSTPKQEASAALLSERGIQAAIEESKLIRSRSFSGVPSAAVQSCLDQTHVGWADIGIIAIAGQRRLSRLRQAFVQSTSSPVSLFSDAYSHLKEISRPGPEWALRQFLKEPRQSSKGIVLCFEHQLCHAASAFYASPFDRALILTLDEKGDGLSGTVALGEGTRIRTLQTMALPHSVGRVYSQATALLGFTPRSEEQKTQWLSLQGEPAFQNVFLEMLNGSSNGRLHLDLSYFNRAPSAQTEFSEKFFRRIGFSKSKWLEVRKEVAPHIASSLQLACTAVLSKFIEKWRQRTGAKHLCLAGGVFLNALLVGDLEKIGNFGEVFVQPASGNAGCSLGAAWLAWHQFLGRERLESFSNLYLGPAFKPAQIKEVLDNCKAPYRWFRIDDERNDETVRLLEAGKIVAWCQGATEFGPRALGNRSLLASPWAPFVKENLNDFIKHREHFRPFALALTAEDCPQYFDCTRQATFMTSIGWAKPGTRELVKEFLLPGNRVRLHVVPKESNPSFWTLLKKFGERSPAPFLINASFNMFGEPLVNSPRDAVRSFYCSGVDALVIDGFLLIKR